MIQHLAYCPLCQGTHGTGKTGKMATKKNPCQGKYREFGNLPKHSENTVNLVCSSCKFPDSKGKGYCDICGRTGKKTGKTQGI